MMTYQSKRFTVVKESEEKQIEVHIYECAENATKVPFVLWIENQEVRETLRQDSEELTLIVRGGPQNVQEHVIQASIVASIKNPINPCPATGFRLAAQTLITVHPRIIPVNGSLTHADWWRNGRHRIAVTGPGRGITQLVNPQNCLIHPLA